MDTSTLAGQLQKHREFFDSGLTRNVSFRAEQLKNLREAVFRFEPDIVAALQADLGKPHTEAVFSEVDNIINECNYALENLCRWTKPRRVSTPLMHFPGTSLVYPEPYGLALIFGAWNLPFHLVMAPLVGALAAGNCAVIKPSEHTPATSALIAKFVTSAFPSALVSVVEGGVPEAQMLLEAKFDYIFYTGNSKIARIVMQQAAKNLTPVTLESGGKCPCIVDADINLETAARRICWGKFLNAGQACISPDYLLVDNKIRAQLVQAIIKTIGEFYGDNPMASPDVARIVNAAHMERLVNILQRSKDKIVYGGHYDKEQKYVQPTVIDNVSWDDFIMLEEVFGPILPILGYDNITEAIPKVNNRPKALALYVFSRRKQFQKHVLASTSSGGVCINDTINHITTLTLPFGGVGNSGMGSYHGRATFDTFTHFKSVMEKGFSLDMKMKYPPYKPLTPGIRKMMRKIS